MISHYQSRIKDIETHISQLRKRDNFFNTARLAAFILFIVALIFSIDKGSSVIILSTLLLLVVFIQVVLMHLKNHNLLTTEITRKHMLEGEIASLELKPGAYYSGKYFISHDHDYTTDMDVFGDGGLYHYINRCATGVGNRSLALWLSEEFPLEHIMQRQSAIKEIAEKKQWCEELRVDLFERRIEDYKREHLPEIRKTIATPAHIKSWIVISYSLLVLSLAGIIFAGFNASLILLPVFINSLINYRMGKFTSTIRRQLEGRERTLNDYHRILTSFESQAFSSAYLKQMQQELKLDEVSATKSIAKLQNLSKKLDYSLSMIVGAVLNLFFLWDVILCRRIALWFDLYAPKTTQWFDVAGRLEALISLANLQNNHPQWQYPHFTDEGFHLKGKNLGHPLIAQSERVNNDFSLEGSTLVNIITGSNMAGKSTFLRTIGVNIILAKAGAVVCAEDFYLSHFRIMTYLTITDSLAENTSTFYREIKRLKKILDSARKDNNVLLLLDELLRGTNSADKAKGSMAITRELISYKVPAIIATHNLELADMKSRFPDDIENYYFDIIIDEQNKMRFDYKLKYGICDTFNASLLLKEIGIDISAG